MPTLLDSHVYYRPSNHVCMRVRGQRSHQNICFCFVVGVNTRTASSHDHHASSTTLVTFRLPDPGRRLICWCPVWRGCRANDCEMQTTSSSHDHCAAACKYMYLFSMSKNCDVLTQSQAALQCMRGRIRNGVSCFSCSFHFQQQKNKRDTASTFISHLLLVSMIKCLKEVKRTGTHGSRFILLVNRYFFSNQHQPQQHKSSVG